MAMHLSAYYQSVDPGGNAVELNAVADELLFTQGKQIRVADNVAALVGCAALTAATAFDEATLRAPSLRVRNDFPVSPLNNGGTFNSPAEYPLFLNNPIGLQPGEALTLDIKSNPASAAAHYGLALFSSGPVQPVNGEIFSAKCTTSITATAGGWTTGPITFEQALPAGRFQVVGLRSFAAGLVATRLRFPNQVELPGFPAWTENTSQGDLRTRFGMPGVLGTFENDVPFSIGVIGGSSTTQTHIVDLIQIS